MFHFITIITFLVEAYCHHLQALSTGTGQQLYTLHATIKPV